MDVLLSIPSLLLSLTVIILLGFGTVNAAIAVGVASVASFARTARGEVVRIRYTDYVEAARGSGGTFVAVLWRHILPNSLTAVLAFATLQFGRSDPRPLHPQFPRLWHAATHPRNGGC